MDALAVGLRAVHIAAAALVIGGAGYQLLAVQPALRGLDDPTGTAVRNRLSSAWSTVVLGCIALLLATGLLNFVLIKVPQWRGHPSAGVYHAMFGLKFLAALAVFHAAACLALPGQRFDKYRARSGFWLRYLIGLFTAIIILGGLMNNLGR